MSRYTHRYMHRGLVVAVLALVALAAGVAYAMTSGGTADVRVAVRPLEDGRVEVGLQQMQDDGSWGERMLPHNRFLPADAEAGAWRVSSSEQVAVSEGDYTICLIDHGQEGDVYWESVHAAAEAKAAAVDASLRIHSNPSGASQADFARGCTADGAQVIIATLASPDAMIPALQEAKAAGVTVFTINSGGELASTAGSTLHLALNDRLSGETLGSLFVKDDLSGPVLCIIHELDNVGLEDRCDGLESTYAGAVERVRIHETGTADLAGSGAAIADALAADDIAGVVALQEDIGVLALDAIAESGDDIVLATFGANDALFQGLIEGSVRYAIYDQSVQLIESMIVTARTLPYSLQYFEGVSVWLWEPYVINQAVAVAYAARMAERAAAQAESESAESESSDGEATEDSLE